MKTLEQRKSDIDRKRRLIDATKYMLSRSEKHLYNNMGRINPVVLNRVCELNKEINYALGALKRMIISYLRLIFKEDCDFLKGKSLDELNKLYILFG